MVTRAKPKTRTDEAPTFVDVADRWIQLVSSTTLTALKTQQQQYDRLAEKWPLLQTPSGARLDQRRAFGEEWVAAISEAMSRRRQVVNEQCKAGLKVLNKALRAVQVEDPQKLRDEAQQIRRDAAQCVRKAVELQADEAQAAVNKWTELAEKACC